MLRARVAWTPSGKAWWAEEQRQEEPERAREKEEEERHWGGSSRAFGLGDPRNRDAAAMRTQMQIDAGAGLPPRTASSLLQR